MLEKNPEKRLNSFDVLLVLEVKTFFLFASLKLIIFLCVELSNRSKTFLLYLQLSDNPEHYLINFF